MSMQADAQRGLALVDRYRLTRRSVIGTGAAVTAAALGGCTTSPVYVEKYKLVLNVEADGRLHQGVNVVKEVFNSNVHPFRLPNEMSIHETYGEANVTDLGGGRFLVALLGNPQPLNTRYPSNWGSDGPGVLIARLYGIPVSSIAYDEKGVSAGSEKLATLRGQVPIGPEDLPVLVTFRDPAKPATAVRVDPNDLAATFGPGVRLVSATLGLTDDPVTHGRIKRYLPALLRPEFGYGYVSRNNLFPPPGTSYQRPRTRDDFTTAEALTLPDFFQRGDR